MADQRDGEPGRWIIAYKTLLRDVIDRRPSGTRRRLAETLGKNPSFISQITNPAYPTPIPLGDVEVILDLCHFSPDERADFLNAYARAHPRRSLATVAQRPGRVMKLKVPEFGDNARNADFDRAVQDFVARLGHLMNRD